MQNKLYQLITKLLEIPVKLGKFNEFKFTEE